MGVGVRVGVGVLVGVFVGKGVLEGLGVGVTVEVTDGVGVGITEIVFTTSQQLTVFVSKIESTTSISILPSIGKISESP